MLRLALLATGWAVATPAFACTLCISDTAEAVRHRLFAHDVLSNAAALAAPLPAIAIAVLLAGAALRDSADGR